MVPFAILDEFALFDIIVQYVHSNNNKKFKIVFVAYTTEKIHNFVDLCNDDDWNLLTLAPQGMVSFQLT